MKLKKSQIQTLIIRIPKDQAAFTYFQLESNEGLFFYSTLEESLKEPYRDLQLNYHQSLETEALQFLKYLENEVKIIILES